LSDRVKVAVLLKKMFLIWTLVLAAILVPIVQAQGGTITATLTDDLYIDDKASMHGTETVLKVSWDYRTFLKFNISSIPKGAENITAVLGLYTEEVPFGWWGHDVAAYPIWNNTWDENTNPPLYEDTEELASMRVISEETWYNWTVTDAVLGAIANNSDAVSIVLRYPLKDKVGEISFSSKESRSNEPKLTITWASVKDVTPPTTTDDYDYNFSWHVSDFTINLNATDNDSGVAATYYRINSGPNQTVSLDGQPYITTEGAANTLEYWSVDLAGNEETPHKVLTNITLDKTAPIGSIQINNDQTYTTSTEVTLTLSFTDATSGVYRVRYSNDGIWDTEVWEPPTATKSWTLTSGDGTKTVYYQIKDNAELASSTYSDTIILSTPLSKAATPTFSPSGDTYSSPQSIVLSCSTNGATIRYTLDGSEPNSLSTLYSNPILISSTTTVKAKAFMNGMTDSDTAQAIYTITTEPQPEKVSTPTFSPVGGTYSSQQNVALYCATSNATIRYTVDGSEPTDSSTVYSSPIAVTSTTTIKAKAFMTGMNDSDTASATYTIRAGGKVATPTFNPEGGSYFGSQYVVILCATPGAIVRYTTSGVEPSSSSLRYYGPIPVSATVTIKAKAFVEGMAESDTAAATYTISSDLHSQEEPPLDYNKVYVTIGIGAIFAVAVGVVFYLGKGKK